MHHQGAICINEAFIDGDAKKATEEYDCVDTMRGVSKRMRFLFGISLAAT